MYSNAVSRGNVAYDLSRFDRRLRVRETYRRKPPEELSAERAPELVRPRGNADESAVSGVRKKSPAKAKRHGLPIFAAAGFLVIISMLLMVVNSYVQLNELSTQSSRLKRELETLKNEEYRLRADYEQKLNLKDIEDYAINRLGMTKPLREQIGYLDSSGSDKVEVLTGGDAAPSAISGLSGVFLSIVEYFR